MADAGMLVADRYRIQQSLGAGGMGRVWLARDEVLHRQVAIKEVALPTGLSDNEREELRERTLREARAAARLNHPNVVRIYDVQAGHDRPWIVMEYVPARSLLQVIKENGPLPVDQVAGIGLAVLAALDAASRVGVVHRDVKPSNVLIAHDGRVLLTDFGSAIMDEGEGALTRTGLILGSPRYIAPERAARGTSTLESDLWSLGATLYEAVEGRTPYTRETTMATLVALATEKPDPVDRAGPLKPILMGLLQKNPKARMPLAEVEMRLRRIADVQSAVWLHQVPARRIAGELSAAASQHVDAVVVGEPVPALATATEQDPAKPARVVASVPFPPPVPSVPWHRRRGVLVGAAAAVATLLTGTVLYSVAGPDLPGTETDQAVAATTSFPASAAASGATASAPAPSATAAVTVPAGFKRYVSKSGFSVMLPPWTKIDESRSSVTLCAPGGPPLVTVREWGRSDPDLGFAMAREETAADLRDYRRIRLEVAPGQDWAEWEYTFTDPKMGALHGVDHAVVRDGRAYLIQFRTPADKWARHLGSFQAIVGTFSPASGTVDPRAVPAGYVRYRSASGFQVAMPKTWTKIKETGTSVTFCAPGGPPLAAVRGWTPTVTDLAAALAREEQLANLPGYRRISIQVLADGSGAVWEYTFRDPKMGQLHGLERLFAASDGAHLLQWRTPTAKWVDNLPRLGVVTGSFQSPTAGNATTGA